jgi:hypothetical protein
MNRCIGTAGTAIAGDGGDKGDDDEIRAAKGPVA